VTDHQFDIVVIGAGIVGLATAMEAVQSLPGLRVAVVEKEAAVARHQTGHNSGVIHSGAYYKPGSLKAANCVAGAAAMKEFCVSHGIAFEVCGKVIVATQDSERPALAEILRRASENGVPGLALIGPEQLRELEPHAQGVEALHIASTGITDYVAVAQTYARIIAAGGGVILTNCRVEGMTNRNDGVVLETTSGAIAARYVINCAGLFSDRIARMAGARTAPQIIPFRGEYYRLAAGSRHLVRNLIYPVPDARLPFLGVHFTRHIDGSVGAGPNAVLALKREGYRWGDISPSDLAEIFASRRFWKLAGHYWQSGLGEMVRSLNKAAFTRALQVLLPGLTADDLEPAGSGVRAQALSADGRLVDDFLIVPDARMIHVCNVPSPAATASIVIGRQIIAMAIARFSLRPGSCAGA
jgi:L-2-hydroxyglutarate oxidase